MKEARSENLFILLAEREMVNSKGFCHTAMCIRDSDKLGHGDGFI